MKKFNLLSRVFAGELEVLEVKLQRKISTSMRSFNKIEGNNLSLVSACSLILIKVQDCAL